MSRRKKKSRKTKIVLGIIFIVFVTLVALALSSNQSEGTQFDVGSPGKGQTAPEVVLPSTDGTTFDLKDYRGEKVLLYFQEGIMCQACWVQLRDIESKMSTFENMGIGEVVTITTDPIDALETMVEMNGFESPVLSDNDVSVSSTYNTNDYGMPGMGSNYNGHSFILVDEEGVISWRADYGRYTMYVPMDTLEKQLRNAIE